MKKIFLSLFVIALIGLNVHIARNSESNLRIHVKPTNALANDEGGVDTFGCYSSFVRSDGGSALKCNQPCCYYKNHVASGDFAGTCAGAFSDCY